MPPLKDKIQECYGDVGPIFYAYEGLSFARLKDGSVVVIFESPGIFVPYRMVKLDPLTWASVLTLMSERGETGETFEEARKFHHSSWYD